MSDEYFAIVDIIEGRVILGKFQLWVVSIQKKGQFVFVYPRRGFWEQWNMANLNWGTEEQREISSGTREHKTF